MEKGAHLCTKLLKSSKLISVKDGEFYGLLVFKYLIPKKTQFEGAVFTKETFSYLYPLIDANDYENMNTKFSLGRCLKCGSTDKCKFIDT